MSRISVLIVLLFLTCICQGQYQKIISFGTVDGLSSNNIYKCIEDNKGFLWIGTDAGVFRFDGKRFQSFTEKQGVPDSDIRNIVKEKNGRLWIEGTSETLAYFDSKQNRFINKTEDSSIYITRDNDSGYKYSPLIALPEGGVQYMNSKRAYQIKDNKVVQYFKLFNTHKNWLLKVNKDSSDIRMVMINKDDSLLYLYHSKYGEVIEKIILQNQAIFIKPYINESTLYLFNSNSASVLLFSDFQANPLRFLKDSFTSSSSYYWHNFTDKYITNLNEKGEVNVYSKKTHQFKFLLACGIFITDMYNDKKGNLWVSSMGEGLSLYTPQKIFSFPKHNNFSKHPFLCIAKKNNGDILAGNYQGQIFEYGLNERIHKLKNTVSTDWQRNIITSQNKIFTLGENGIHVNYVRKINRRNGNNCKIAFTLNDSTIICGYKNGIEKLNTISEKITTLKTGDMYITSLASIDKNCIYFGSSDGLHTYFMDKDTCLSLPYQNPLLNQSIVSMCSTVDSLLWIATASNGILVVKNNKVILHITDSYGIQISNPQTIASGRNHQIWVGTNHGISIINYASEVPQIQNLSVNDGLTSNVINQMSFSNDTMYAATDNGISVIPANISIPTFNIPIELIGLKINNRDTILTQHYQLKPKQNNIIIQFAGVELTGHFRHAQYSMNEGLSWANQEGNSLSLELGSGEHTVWLRALDVNGNVSTKILKLQFDIETPFQKTWWFRFMMALIAITIAVLIYSQHIKQKHKQQIDKFLNQQALDELEIQALKAQINPHFVFNCLNSIKGIIYDEDFERANNYLNKFALMLRSTLNFSSQSSITLKAELDYIDNYLTLEKLRFGNKFEYFIEAEKELKQEEIYIPAMLLQPFIENAINHGIAHLRERQGIIMIKAYIVNGFLQINIDDNGIGRERAAALNKERSKTHESKGTQLTERRMKLYHITSNITDKKDNNEQGCGTSIVLIIPIPL